MADGLWFSEEQFRVLVPYLMQLTSYAQDAYELCAEHSGPPTDGYPNPPGDP